MKRSRFYGLLLVNVFVVAGLFFMMRQAAEAQWVLRDGTAVNPIKVCRDGAYIGVGHQGSNPGYGVGVTGNLLPSEDVLFSQVFTPTTPVSRYATPWLGRADFYLVNFDQAYVPLAVGAQVDMGYVDGIPVIGEVEDCFLNDWTDPTGVSFTYQGRLDDDGSAANGNYDLTFRIYDAAVGGTLINGVVHQQNVVARDGLFTVKLDVGEDVFTGGERWLEIAVRDLGSSGSYTVLSPRQEITSVPYAMGLRVGASISGETVIGEGVLSLSNSLGEGLVIEDGFNGIRILSSQSAGILVDSVVGNGVIISETGGIGIDVIDSTTGVSIGDASETGIAIGDTGSSGISINSAGSSGISVSSAEGYGVYVGSAGSRGMYVSSAETDGYYVYRAGDASTYNSSNSQSDGLEISNAEDDGVYVGHADDDGIHVNSAADSGLVVTSAGTDGLIVVGTTTGDGVDIDGAADNGIEVSGATDYAGYFSGNVFVTGSCTGCKLATFGVNSGQEALAAGDIVAINGMHQAAELDSAEPVMSVSRARAGQSMVGVVAGMAELVADEETGEMQLVPRDGVPAKAGDYVTIVTYGVVQVRVTQSGGDIEAGQRVTLSNETNTVRRLETTEVNGIQLAEDAPTIGTALEDSDENQDGLIWVLINPR